jgi:hypothetical protein
VRTPGRQVEKRDAALQERRAERDVFAHGERHIAARQIAHLLAHVNPRRTGAQTDRTLEIHLGDGEPATVGKTQPAGADAFAPLAPAHDRRFAMIAESGALFFRRRRAEGAQAKVVAANRRQQFHSVTLGVVPAIAPGIHGLPHGNPEGIDRRPAAQTQSGDMPAARHDRQPQGIVVQFPDLPSAP